MHEEEYIIDYITSLMTADVELSDDRPGEIRFNGTLSPGEFNTLLLQKEMMASKTICRIILDAADSKPILGMVHHQHLLDMKGVISLRDGHYTHRYLRFRKNGEECVPQQIDSSVRTRVDLYLRVAQDSFLRLHAWSKGLPPVSPSPLYLNVTESETAEMLSFLFDTGIAGCTEKDWRKKDYIHYFCRTWNLPVDKDYDTLMSHVKDRPNPTPFLDRIKQLYLDHIESRDNARK